MENTRKSNIDFGTIAWGAFFILWGITEMFKSLPDGTGTLGIGVILLDLVMPGMSGFEVAERLKQVRDGLAALIESHRPDEAALENEMNTITVDGFGGGVTQPLQRRRAGEAGQARDQPQRREGDRGLTAGPGAPLSPGRLR